MNKKDAKQAGYWVEIGCVEDIPVLGARVIRTGEGDIAVFRTRDDDIFALDDCCPHQGGPLSQGIVFGKRVACPLHNWNIDLDEGCAVAPDEGCTRRYPIRVEQGRISIELNAQHGGVVALAQTSKA